jgi:putative transposase
VTEILSEVWKTAEGWAAEGLPGIPTSKSAVIRMAGRDDWPARDRQGRGGGREYPLAALPKAARSEFMRRQLLTGRRDVVPAAPALPARTESLRGWQRSCLEARAALLAEVDRLAVTVGVTEARRLVAEASAAGTLPPDLQELCDYANNRKGERAGVSAVSLKRWDLARGKQGLAALAPKPMAPLGTSTPAWVPYFLDLYQIAGQPSVAACWEKMPAVLPPTMAMPPLRTVHRHIASLPELHKNRGRMGPRALKALKAYTARDVSELWPTAIYVPDGHTLKASVAHPIHGRPFRPEVTTIVDVYTRKIVGWSAALSENTIGTLDACRHAFERSGVCDIYYSDRGRGFNNATFDAAETGFFGRWGVTKKQARAYGSQARGVIERVHPSVWVRGARFLPSFDGRGVDKEIYKRVSTRIETDLEAHGASPLLMQWDEFLIWAQEQADAYNTRPHSELPRIVDPVTGKRRHQSPAEVWQAAIDAGWTPDTMPADENPDLYRPQIMRRVSRCLIEFKGNQYFHLDLTPYHDREVLVGYDIHDASRVWVRTAEQELICVAQWNGHRTAFMPITVAQDAHEKRVSARIKRGEKRLEKIEAEGGPRLIEHRPTVTLPVIAEADREAVFARMTQQPAAPETPADRYARFLDLAARSSAGEALSEFEARWVESYRTSSECRVEAMAATMRADFDRRLAAGPETPASAATPAG